MGFDGKKIRIKLYAGRGCQPLWFEALLGVGITVNDYDKFVVSYEAIIVQIN